MIRQFIFASPKPGISEHEFQDYWVNKHAVNFAAKIPQIRKYLVNTRVENIRDQGEAYFSGMAEIWLRPEEQIASLQSKEFLEGARRDEPNWAAFWKTLALDTREHLIKPDGPEQNDPPWIKAVVLLKRKGGMPVSLFRQYALKVHAPNIADQEVVQRYVHCQTVDGAYTMGEPAFDAVDVFYFRELSDWETAFDTGLYPHTHMQEVAAFCDLNKLFTMTVRENWIIGPRPRD